MPKALESTLNTLSADRLREAIRLMYASNETAAEALEASLLVDGKCTPRFEQCINPGCGEEFDVTKNEPKACVWHLGLSDLFLTSWK